MSLAPLASLREKPSDLYITDQLLRRSDAHVDYQQEMVAIWDLAGRMLDAPEQVLPRFVELAMRITEGASAGLSLFEPQPSPGVFRWRYLKGVLAPFENATTPRDFSPCGVTLDEGRPVLSRHPERFYNWISDADIVVPEVLLVPLHFAGGEPIGTLWIVAENEGYFNASHARAAADLAHFAGIALRVLETQQQLKTALEQQEMLTAEMNHRVKNLFTVAQSLVRMTSKTTQTKEEMTDSLAGRFFALSRAHALVRKSFSPDTKEESHDLGNLLSGIVEPHQRNVTGLARIAVNGPRIPLGEQSLSSAALVFHELTTNAVKYGALTSEDGRIDIQWTRTPDGILEVDWIESGGAEIRETPELNGFGSRLLRDTIQRQFNGTLEKTWNRGGVKVRITIPVAKLTP